MQGALKGGLDKLLQVQLLDLSIGCSVLPLSLLLGSCRSKTDPGLLSTDPVPSDKPGRKISKMFTTTNLFRVLATYSKACDWAGSWLCS